MAGPNRPKGSPLVDSEWVGAAGTNRDKGVQAGRVGVPKDDEVTVQTSMGELMARATEDETTEVTPGLGDLLPPSSDMEERALDSLLASNEAQRLWGSAPPPQPRPKAPEYAPPPPPADLFVPKLSHPTPPPAPQVSAPESALSHAQTEELPKLVNSGPPQTASRYAEPMDSSSVAGETVSRGGGGARLILVLGIALPLAVGAGILVGMRLAPQPAPVVMPTPSAVKEPTTKGEEKPPQTVLERAATGDFKAIDEIKKRSPAERSAEETLALSQGRSINKRLALEGFAAELKKNPDLLKDAAKIERLKDFLLDRETTNQTASVLVNLPGPLGPDLLYDAWIGTKIRGETTILSEELLQAKEVKSHASPALMVAIDLRNAQECEQFKEILPRAAEHGDRRSVTMLSKLVSKRGCGATKRDDCYACLRPLEDDKEAIDVADAIKAARKRAAPKY